MTRKICSIVISIVSLFALKTHAQPDRWQQQAEYYMDIIMDVNSHKFEGKQKLVYYNNSPDTLTKVFYHLYYNAFQPGSAMDARCQNIPDPTSRIGGDKIAKLKKNEMGYQHISSLKKDGVSLTYKTEGTILEVNLDKPILPNTTTTFEMVFDAQIPILLRRTGRNNNEGIDYSMAQWYPKMAEYDMEGWHADPYVAQEFYGVWGDFEVKITIDSKYTIGATGYLQNPNQVGHGYENEGITVQKPGKTTTWHFIAPKVHDFVWAADPDYIHTKLEGPNDIMIHLFYDQKSANIPAWEELPENVIRVFEYMNSNFGVYPYKQFSVIQGGDGGMEYPMSTLIQGSGQFEGMFYKAITHEMCHSWFQGVVANNETKYPWMDEGFSTYAEYKMVHYLKGNDPSMNPYENVYRVYFLLANSPVAEPLSISGDYLKYNGVYSINSYYKGSVLLSQLSYVIGEDNLMNGMRKYFNTWKFKHPTPVDHMRIMEKISGIELDWYYEHFINSIDMIDYGIDTVMSNNGVTSITLSRIESMMMPIDLVVEYTDGTKEMHYIPLSIMRGEKPVEDENLLRIVQNDWVWTNPTYRVELSRTLDKVKSVEIDPSMRMADVDRRNNKLELNDVGILAPIEPQSSN